MAGAQGAVCFYDRSPICTYALAAFLDKTPSAGLMQAISKMRVERQYADTVLFVEPLGQIENTAVRQLSYESALSFGTMHRKAYGQFGYQCLSIVKGPTNQRLQKVLNALAAGCS